MGRWASRWTCTRRSPCPRDRRDPHRAGPGDPGTADATSIPRGTAQRPARWSAGERQGTRYRSEIPVGCGLEDSSALGTALTLAVARAKGNEPTAEAAAHDGMRIAREIGQSATGAFDDCMASVLPGIWITDNRTDAILRHDPVPPGLEVVVSIPGASSPVAVIDRFRATPGKATVLALGGRPWEALEANGRAVELALGTAPLDLEEVRALGAVASPGVSGLGPAGPWSFPRPRRTSQSNDCPATGHRASVAFSDGARRRRSSMTGLRIQPGRAEGTRAAPPSKSYTHRALVAAASLSTGYGSGTRWTRRTPGARIRGLEQLRYPISRTPGEWSVGPRDPDKGRGRPVRNQCGIRGRRCGSSLPWRPEIPAPCD